MAETLEEGWLRHLEASGIGESKPATDLAALLRGKLELGAPGMYGFDVDEGPALERSDGRRLLARLVSDLALEVLRAMRGEPADASLAFRPNLDPYWQARWLEPQERIHELLCLTLDDPPSPLRLPVDETMRAAMTAIQLGNEVRGLFWLRKHREAGADPRRELALRRRQRDEEDLAANVFTREHRRVGLYELADLEESLALFSDAAESTRRAALLEDDPQVAKLAEAIAVARCARVGGLGQS
jgi:hypothetical protein